MLGSVVGTLGVYNFTYAQTQSTDCAETARSQESQYVNVVLEQVQKMNPPYTLTIFTDKDLKTALRYHQQYCCQEEVSEDSCQ